MQNHDELREFLALAAAEELSEEEANRLRAHAAQCEACARELASFGETVLRLTDLPPAAGAAPPYLAARTLLAAKRERRVREETRSKHRVLAFLVAFSWACSFATWPAAHLLSGMGFWNWLIFSALFGWATAGCAALVVSANAGSRGRKYESLS